MSSPDANQASIPDSRVFLIRCSRNGGALTEKALAWQLSISEPGSDSSQYDLPNLEELVHFLRRELLNENSGEEKGTFHRTRRRALQALARVLYDMDLGVQQGEE
jgi:hypothetical protein